MNAIVYTLQQKVEKALAAAIERGAYYSRELETVARVELGVYGFTVSGAPRITAFRSGSGIRVHVDMFIVELPPPPARVIPIYTARSVRRCDVCEGDGCLWCFGRGWHPRCA